METKKVVVEVPKKADAENVKALVKRLFSFDVKKYYGKAKGFPSVRITWKPYA
jgi:ribosomal protein L23